MKIINSLISKIQSKLNHEFIHMKIGKIKNVFMRKLYFTDGSSTVQYCLPDPIRN